MKRALSIVAAFLLLLTAFTPPPPAAVAAPTPGQQTVAPRHTLTIVNAAHPQRYITVQRGDTYGKWATLHCGTYAAWTNIQTANRWPERRIPVGATATIVCDTNTVPAPPPATPAPATGKWVHPLASGKRGNSCYHTPKRPTHAGVDMGQPTGTPIRAAHAGTIHAKRYEARGAGYYVIVKHPNAIYTRYFHMRAHSPLPTGTHVTAGQTIGYVGNTGNSRGAHLHYEVLKGGDTNKYRTNPATFMRDRGVNIGC